MTLDFKLQDAAGTQHNTGIEQIEGYNPMTSVNVAKGGTSGPQGLTFEPQSNLQGLPLIWQNSSDLFGGPLQVKLN